MGVVVAVGILTAEEVEVDGMARARRVHGDGAHLSRRAGEAQHVAQCKLHLHATRLPFGIGCKEGLHEANGLGLLLGRGCIPGVPGGQRQGAASCPLHALLQSGSRGAHHIHTLGQRGKRHRCRARGGLHACLPGEPPVHRIYGYLHTGGLGQGKLYAPVGYAQVACSARAEAADGREVALGLEQERILPAQGGALAVGEILHQHFIYGLAFATPGECNLIHRVAGFGPDRHRGECQCRCSHQAERAADESNSFLHRCRIWLK